MNATSVSILETQSGEAVKAELRMGLTAAVLIDTEAQWGPIRVTKVQELVAAGTPKEKIPQHFHWSWGNKSQHLELLAYQCIGIWCDGAMQGLMMVNTVGHVARVEPDEGKPLVYIEYLETAPWNLEIFTATPRYGAVGSRLIEAAVRLSLMEGFHGRVGLHSLPQAAGFYQGACKMVSLGTDSSYQNLPYFELTQEGARTFLRGTTQ